MKHETNRIADLEATLRWLQYQSSRVEWPEIDGEVPPIVARVLQEVIRQEHAADCSCADCVDARAMRSVHSQIKKRRSQANTGAEHG